MQRPDISWSPGCVVQRRVPSHTRWCVSGRWLPERLFCSRPRTPSCLKRRDGPQAPRPYAACYWTMSLSVCRAPLEGLPPLGASARRLAIICLCPLPCRVPVHFGWAASCPLIIPSRLTLPQFCHFAPWRSRRTPAPWPPWHRLPARAMGENSSGVVVAPLGRVLGSGR
jgi:hypothetical protein